MARFSLFIEVADVDLHTAISMIYPQVQPEEVVKDYFDKTLVVDFNQITDLAKRAFILSGTVANHILLHEEMEDAAPQKPTAKIITLNKN